MSAGDTLLVNGASLGEAQIRAEMGTVCLIRAIERLELKASKTEVVAFMSKNEHVPGLEMIITQHYEFNILYSLFNILYF